MEAHAAGMVAHDGVGMRGGVIKELSGGFLCGECCSRLFGSEGVESNKHRNVNGSSVEEKTSDNLLDVCDLVWREDRQVMVVLSVLDFLAVDGLVPFFAVNVVVFLDADGGSVVEFVEYNLAWRHQHAAGYNSMQV